MISAPAIRAGLNDELQELPLFVYTVIFSGSLHKIRKSLKKEHNIEISHQSIENIIFLNLIIKLSIKNWTFSGYLLV